MVLLSSAPVRQIQERLVVLSFRSRSSDSDKRARERQREWSRDTRCVKFVPAEQRSPQFSAHERKKCRSKRASGSGWQLIKKATKEILQIPGAGFEDVLYTYLHSESMIKRNNCRRDDCITRSRIQRTRILTCLRQMRETTRATTSDRNRVNFHLVMAELAFCLHEKRIIDIGSLDEEQLSRCGKRLPGKGRKSP